MSRSFSLLLLIAVSGGCALIYQTVWMREFRLIFGASTLSTAAVLSVFMGGLGIGNAIWGRLADRAAQPLRMYGQLEISIALLVGLSPWLTDAVDAIYLGTGGQAALGRFWASVLRLVLTAVVLLGPTIAMGGTLPAVVCAATTRGDVRRGAVGLVYAANTLGAVAGAMIATFLALEMLGSRRTAWLSCLVNLAVGLGALVLARNWPTADMTGAVHSNRSVRRQPDTPTAGERAGAAELPASLIYAVAAMLGFSFFVMELVWYRMLSPLLGGTTYTFGLILSWVLLGIGLGGLLYPVISRWLRPSVSLLAFTIGLEALVLAIPYALGDRIAYWSLLLRPEVQDSFGRLIQGWSIIAALVVFPASLVSGFQFPAVIAMLGEARESVGRQTGVTVAWNTAGAIAGSLAGGFILIPWLGALGSWQATVASLAAVAAGLSLWPLLAFRWTWRDACWLVSPLAAVGCLAAVGPTAVWRHNQIGVYRAALPGSSPRELTNWEHQLRRQTRWETDGIEASVAIQYRDGLAFVINGKIDGNAVGDVGTQMMLGLHGAILHGQPRTAAVIGLGTGQSAGWLADYPTIQRVDVIELEPAMIRVAAACSSVNRDVLRHPKVQLLFNDAREALQTTRTRYDLVVSEPSNPYLVGIANLFTRDFYREVADRLNDDGLFVQWLQAYEIDRSTIVMVLSTLRSVFGHVEVWNSQKGGLLLVCSREPQRWDGAQIDARLQLPVVAEALRIAWLVEHPDEYWARYLAGPRTVEKLASEGVVNRDDRNLLEFRLARALREKKLVDVQEFAQLARSLGDDLPADISVDSDQVAWNRLVNAAHWGETTWPLADAPRLQTHVWEIQAYAQGKFESLVPLWSAPERDFRSPVETIMAAIVLAVTGHPRAFELADQLSEHFPNDAAAIRALATLRQGNQAETANLLRDLCLSLRQKPWLFSELAELFPLVAVQIANQSPDLARVVSEGFEAPFAVGRLEESRLEHGLLIASLVGPQPAARMAEQSEPHVAWNERILRLRADAYRTTNHPLQIVAERDLARYRRQQSATFTW